MTGSLSCSSQAGPAGWASTAGAKVGAARAISPTARAHGRKVEASSGSR